MRLCTLTTSYPRDPADHAGRFVRDLNAGLIALGCEVTTVAPGRRVEAAVVRDSEAGSVHWTAAPDRASRELFFGDGMEANARRLGPWRTWLGLRRFAARARETVSGIACDAVIAHWLFPGAWIALGAGSRTPVVGVCHGGDAHLLASPIVGRVLASRLRRSAGVVAVSAAAAAIVRGRLGASAPPVLRTPMGFNGAVFRPTGAERDPSLVVAVGRLARIKGFDVLLHAVAGEGLRLVVAGDGAEAGALRALASWLGVDATFPGRLPPAPLADLLRRAAVVAAPSRVGDRGRVEGLPVAALEGAACGAAVVGTRAGGLPDLLPEAALAAPGDPASLREVIRRALAEPAACRVDVRKFERAEVARRVLEFVRALPALQGSTTIS